MAYSYETVVPTLGDLTTERRPVQACGFISLTGFDEAAEVVSFNFFFNTLYAIEGGNTEVEPSLSPWRYVGDYDGFVPSVHFDNQMSCEVSTTTYLSNTDNVALTVIKGNASIKIRTNFRDFPFDLQAITVYMMSDNCTFTRMREAQLQAGVDEFTLAGVPSNFVVQTFVVRFGSLSLDFKIGITRKTTYYLYSYILVIYFIFASNVTVLAIDPEEIDTRLGISLSLFLTLTAFKYVVADGVSKSDYISSMDRFNIWAFAGITLATFENVAVGKIPFKDPVLWDIVFQSILLLLWTLYFLRFAYKCYRPKRSYNDWKAVDRQYFTDHKEYHLVAQSIQEEGKHISMHNADFQASKKTYKGR